MRSGTSGKKYAFKYIYGPVPSWRLGSSLGIDLLSQKDKVCNFECVYCQLGLTHQYTLDRATYVPVEKVIEELRALPETKIDYITFSGRGEPTLALNLGEAIRAVKALRKERIAVLTNSSLMPDARVRKDLMEADFVAAKLDGFSPASLAAINRPAPAITFDAVVNGIKAFKKEYKGRLALQMMFLESNKGDVSRYADMANDIGPHEVQLNTPLRHSVVKPLSKNEMSKIRSYFVSACKGADIVSVYDERIPLHIVSFSDEDTLRRRGKIE